MNYDLDTPEGLENSITWMEQLLASIKDGGTWGIPRSLSVYTISCADDFRHRPHLEHHRQRGARVGGGFAGD